MKNRISAALRGAIDAVKKKPFVLVCVLAAVAAVAAAVFAFRGGKETAWNKNALAAGLPEITAGAAEYSFRKRVCGILQRRFACPCGGIRARARSRHREKLFRRKLSARAG